MDNKLWNKNFILLWLGQAVSQIGDGAGYIALIWWVQTTTGSAVALAGLAMTKSAVRVFLGPIAGVIADRFSRRAIILYSDLLRGLIYLFLAYQGYRGVLNLSIVIVAGAITTALHSFFMPAVTSALPSLVPKQHLPQANSFRQMTQNITNIISYAAGGILVALMGIPALLLIDGVSYLLSAISELFIEIPLVSNKNKSFNWNVFIDDLQLGMKYVLHQSFLLKLIKIAIVVNLFIAPLMVLLPKFVSDHLIAGSAVYGYLLSAMMAGTLFATILIAFFDLGDKFHLLSKASILFVGLSLCGFALAPVGYLILHTSLLFIMGFFIGIVDIYVDTILQRIIQPNMLGKVYGFLGSFSGGMQPLAQGISGFAANYISVKTVFAACGMPIVVTGISFMGADEMKEDKTKHTQVIS